MPSGRHLLFDFGGPVLLSPFELTDEGAAGLGVDPAALSRGPFGADRRWRLRVAGEISEREYWSGEAEKFGLDVRGYLAPFYEPSGDHLIRPASVALIDEVLADGRTVGLLTNDLTAFHGEGWHDRISVLTKFDPLIDLSTSGVLKPDPRAYSLAIDAMRVAPGDIVFVDDHHDNVAAADAAGLLAVWFDITAPGASIERARAALAGDASR